MKKRPRKFEPGIILGTIFRFSAWMYGLLSESFAAGVAQKTAESAERKFKRDTSSRTRRWIKGAKRNISRLIENSLFTYVFELVTSFIKRCRLRVYAMFFLSGGIYTFLIALIKRFSLQGGEWSISHIFFSLFLCALSVPLFFSDKKLSEVLQDSILTRTLLFSAMGLSARDIKNEGAPRGKMNIAFLLGLALGVSTYLIDPFVIALGTVGIAAACFTMISPEFAVIAILFFVPFLVILPHPSIILAAMVLLATFSLLVKMLRGKRIVRFEKLDIIVLIFMAAELLGGLVSFGGGSSLKSSLIYTCFILGYFLIVALMRTRKWLSRAVGSLMTSSAIVAAYGIYQYVTGNIETTWLDTEMFSDIQGRACSTFENPNMLALYLVMIFPIAFASVRSSKSRGDALKRLGVCALLLGCTVLTWSRGAWLGVAFAMILFMLIVSHKTISLFVAGVFALPFLPAILPSSIWNRLSSIGNLADTSTSYRVNIWKGTFSMLSDFWGSGIGVGQSAFSQVYPSYSLAAIERAPHSHNLYLQILTELGIGGLVLFVLLLIAFSMSNLNYMRTAKDTSVRLYTGAAFCSILAALVQGMTEYVWYNYRVFFVFWVILGLAVAFRRVGQENEERAAQLSLLDPMKGI